MILDAIDRAYFTMRSRNWDTLYWCIDLHGSCIKSNYQNGNYEFINEDAKKALMLISSLPETCIILWSCCHAKQKQEILEFFKLNNINVNFFNENPLVLDNETGNFSEKFYFNVLIDDKAGFDPNKDWFRIFNYFQI